MGIVDTIMVGPLGAEAIGGAGIGSNTFIAVAVFGMGLLLGLDTLVSQAFGARRIEECHRWLVHGVALALILTIPITVVVRLLVWSLDVLGARSSRSCRSHATIWASSAGASPRCCSLRASDAICRRRTSVRPVMFALVSANLINALVNWILIFGKLGAPAMGVRGAAWATVAARTYMTLFLLGTIVYRERVTRQPAEELPLPSKRRDSDA